METDGNQRGGTLAQESFARARCHAAGDRSGSGSGCGWGCGRFFRQFVTGDLFPSELIERFVGVETLDHVITIAPRPRTMLVVFESLGLGVADHVEPMLGLAFAVSWVGQPAIDQSFVRIGATVRFKIGNVLGLRRQAE